MTLLLPVLLVASFATACISAIFGMAGGVMLLAVMAALLPARDVVPLHGVVQLFSNVSRVAIAFESVRWQIVLAYAPCALVGALGASYIWAGASLSSLRTLIGLTLVAFFVWRKLKPKPPRFPIYGFCVVGLVAGFLSVFVGATGPFLAPFFLQNDLSNKEIISTKATCQFITHAVKPLIFLFAGYHFGPHLLLLAAMIGVGFLGVQLGTAIVERMPAERFQSVLLYSILAMGIYLTIAGALNLNVSA